MNYDDPVACRFNHQSEYCHVCQGQIQELATERVDPKCDPKCLNASTQTRRYADTKQHHKCV